MLQLNLTSEKYDNLFISDDPKIRVRLAQLALAFGNALVAGDLDLAYRVREEAVQLRGDLETSDVQIEGGDQ